MAVHKDDSGWSVDFYYFDWRGKRQRYRRKGFKTKREAQAFIVSFKNKKQTADMSFGQLYEIYKEDYKIHVKPTTYDTRTRMINMRILPFFKDILLSKITPATIRKWQNDLLTDTILVKNKEQKLSSTYLATLHRTLSAIFNFAVKYYGLSENPARRCGRIGTAKTTNIDFWTIEEFKQFISYCTTDTLYYTIFMVLFWTGMRQGELLALTLEDFNFDDHTITISKTYVRLKKVDIVQSPKTKNAYRTIILPTFLETILRNYISSIPELRKCDRIFPITRNALQLSFRKYIVQANVKMIRLHDLRHSHASFLIDQGFSLLAIKERLGHRDIKTTLNTYSHLYPSQQEKLQRVMEHLGSNENVEKNK